MKEWKLDFEWLRVRHYIRERMEREHLPDLNTILFIIGIQELGFFRKFSKEEKQDLMHIAICTLLASDGYYIFRGRDEEGWPHFERVKPFTVKGENAQEEILKKKIIHYFALYEEE